MNIGIDCRFIERHSGLSTYVRNLVDHLLAQGTGEEYTLFVPATVAPTRFQAAERNRITLWPLKSSHAIVSEQVLLPSAVRASRVDLIHYPYNTAPLFAPRETPAVVTIHDAIFALPASMVPRGRAPSSVARRIYYRLASARAASLSILIMTSSEHSKRDLAVYLKIDPKRIRVVYLAPSDEFFRAPISLIGADYTAGVSRHRPYVLGYGSLEPRKNAKATLAAFAYARSRLDASTALILIGVAESAWRGSTLRQQAVELGIDDAIVIPGLIDVAELREIYAHALLFVFPSYYEGFGLPVVEAMASGAPVLTADRGSVSEIAADAAVWCQPDDVCGLAAAIVEVCSNAARRTDLRERARAQAGRYSWERTARATSAVYREAVARSRC